MSESIVGPAEGQLPGELAPYWGKFPRPKESTMRASTSTTFGTFARSDWLSQETIPQGTPRAWPSACQHRREPWTIIKSAPSPSTQVAGGLIAGDPAAGLPWGISITKGLSPPGSPSMCISSVQMARVPYCRAEVPHLAGEPTLAGLQETVRVMESCHFTTGARPRVRCHFHSYLSLCPSFPGRNS